MKSNPVTGDLRQTGPNVECYDGKQWFLLAKNTTLFLMMCINAELTPEEVLAQAVLKCPKDPRGFILKEMETAQWISPEADEEEEAEYLN